MANKNGTKQPALSRTWLLLLLAFVIPAAVEVLMMALNQVTPFGTRSIAVQDGNIQYIEFFNYYRNMFHGQDTLLYSFTNFLGGSGVALFAYYLASPFNFLILLVPASMDHALFSLMVVLKLGLCGLTMAFFLKKRFPTLQPLFVLVLSVCYGLMQYNIAQSMNIMWLDGVYMLPLILLGVHYLVQNGKSFLFLFATGAAILFNWYAGYFDCIAAVLFFIFELTELPEGTLTTGQKWQRFGSALGHGVLAVLLSAVLFLPSVLALVKGKGTSEFKFDMDFSGNPLTSLAGLSMGTESFDGGLAIFCGSLVSLGLILYFTSKQFSFRNKLRSGLLLVLFLLLAYFEPLEYVANGFRDITSYWYRYGYIIIAYLIFLAAYYYANVREETVSRLYKAATAGVAILFLCEFLADLGELDKITFTSAFLFLFAWMLTKLLPVASEGGAPAERQNQSRRWLSAALVLAVCVELGASGVLIQRSIGFSKVGRYQDYHANRTEKVQSIKSADESFYRIAQTDYRQKTSENLTAYFDDSYSYAYNGIAHYSSTYSNKQAELMCHLGYASDPTVPVTTTRMLPADSLLSVKYVLGEKVIPGLTVAEDLGDGIRRNPFYVAPALVVQGTKTVNYDDYKDNPFEYQNALYSELLGHKVTLYTKVDVKTKRDKTHDRYLYTIPEQPENTVTYFSVATKGWAHGKLYVNGKFMTEYAYWLTPQVVRLPQKSTTTKDTVVRYQYISGENKIGKPYCYTVDLKELAAVTAELNAKEPSSYCIEAGNVAATVTAETENEQLYLSVPTDIGWNVAVNGKSVETKEFADCFYLIPLEQGDNDIRMTYTVPGLKAGAVLSALTLAASLILLLFFRRKDRRV